MKRMWFKRTWLFYLPVPVIGLLIILTGIIYMIPACISILKNGHSVNDDLYELTSYGPFSASWLKWITVVKTSE